MFIRQNYRIYPNSDQKIQLNQWLGQGRYIWNRMLDNNIKEYEKNKKFIFKYDMNNLLPEIKNNPETSWLKEIPSQCLQQKCQDLDTALKQSFKTTKNKKGFPKFKSKKTDESGIRFPSFKFEGNRIMVPKMKKGIKIKLHRDLLGKKGAITISKDKVGNYFASILVELPENYFPPQINLIETGVGIDVGLKEFAITSDAEIIANPKFYGSAEKKISKLQKSHSKKQRGSKNKEKARIKLAKSYKKVTNQRKDFTNKTSNSIVKNNDIVVVETLNVQGMLKNHKLAKSIADVSWYQFHETLKWQCIKQGKIFTKINPWYPSSKKCSCCGEIKKDLELKDRIYQCSSCGFELDRDFNAAINIYQEGLSKYTAGTAEINACGDMSCGSNSAQEALDL
nr:MAG: putative transposase [Caudoviricetes sp.]